MTAQSWQYYHRGPTESLLQTLRRASTEDTLFVRRHLAFCSPCHRRFGGQYPDVAMVNMTKPTNRLMPTRNHFPSSGSHANKPARIQQSTAITAARRRNS